MIEWVVSHGGLDQLQLSPPCPTLAAAQDLKRAIYRSARYWCSCGRPLCTRKYSNINGCPKGGQRVSCSAEVVRDPDKQYRVQFMLYDKQEAMREVVRKYGPDPNNWPYFSRRKKLESA